MSVLVEARNLVKHYEGPRRFLGLGPARGAVRAVDGVGFTIERGQALGLVGESGCGKTTVARLLLRLTEPTAGDVFFAGDSVFALDGARLRALRRRMQIVVQDPYGSLNPRMRVRRTVAEPLEIPGLAGGAELTRRVERLLDKVGLDPALGGAYPHELSGGQRQRVAIARAMVVDPRFVVADEPTSMLDVSVRAGIMDLLLDLKRDLGLSYLYITHDLAVARYMCDRIAVMYLGKIVEMAETEELLSNPQHPYTRALLSAVPVPDPKFKRLPVEIKGGISKAINPPPTCRFLDRCTWATDICHREEHPPLEDKGGEHYTACYLVDRG